jgi:hypothetical protein
MSEAAGPRGREGWGCCICAVFSASMIDRRSLLPRQAVRAWLAGASDPSENLSQGGEGGSAQSLGSRSPSAASYDLPSDQQSNAVFVVRQAQIRKDRVVGARHDGYDLRSECTARIPAAAGNGAPSVPETRSLSKLTIVAAHSFGLRSKRRRAAYGSGSVNRQPLSSTRGGDGGASPQREAGAPWCSPQKQRAGSR